MNIYKAVRRASALIVILELALGNSGTLDAVPLPPLRRVNAPYFRNGVLFEQTAIFWFGKVSPTENYADVRIGYDDSELFVHVTIFDRRLWYDESPTAATLASWDAVALFLDRDGNIGGAPDARSYRFVGQVNWWEDRNDWQAAYQGGQWSLVQIPFATATGFKWESGTVGGFNNDQNNRGWVIEYRIPFTSLGLSTAPAQGTVWGLGIVLHDRDVGSGPLNPDKVWPESMAPNSPATWGQLYFGMPAYTPLPAIPRGATVIRHGLNGAVVTDAAVGGTVNNLCPGDPDYIWNQWADFKDPHGMQFNVQNQGDVSDWPCFAKYFVTFPMGAVPSGKAIMSATLTLHQFGNAGQGWTPPPEPSYLQVLTIGQDWNEDTLTWNTAPLARENVGGSWVDPLPGYGGDPGIPRNWDVSKAVAEAYAAGEPLRLAVYSADWSYHSGRYFWSSDHDDYRPEARPSLTVSWGDLAAMVQKRVYPVAPKSGQAVTYTISLVGSGHPLTLTDDLPPQVSAPGRINVEGGGLPAYDGSAHRLLWMYAPQAGQLVTLTFPVTVTAPGPLLVRNTAVLSNATGSVSSGTALFIVDALQVRMPFIVRQ